MIRSTTILWSVLNKYDITPIDFCVGDFIYKYTTREGYCTNSLSNIADEIKMSTRSITTSVSKLVNKGFIENIGSKNSPKYRGTPLWFDLVVTDLGGEVNKEDYKKICEDVINYINNKFQKNYTPETYYDNFRKITNKTFNGKKISGELMVNVFIDCKKSWGEKYQSSVTPATIFGNKFMTKYLIKYHEKKVNEKTYSSDRRNLARI